jgi:predicted membrane metal-binding protein
VHGQLNDGGFDSQRYALAQHRPLSGGIVAASAPITPSPPHSTLPATS